MVKLSLREVLMVVGFVAVALAALLNASAACYSGIFSATLLVMLVSIVAAFSCRDAKRVFWFGFSVFGWGYLFLTIGPLNRFGPGVGMLATHKTLESFYSMVRENPIEYGFREHDDDDPFAFGFDGIGADWHNFQRTGHALWALVLAFAGGKVGVYFYTTPEGNS